MASGDFIASGDFVAAGDFMASGDFVPEGVVVVAGSEQALRPTVRVETAIKQRAFQFIVFSLRI